MICTATLVKRCSASGLVGVEDDVPLGKQYQVLPSFTRTFTALHESGVYHEVKMIMTADGGWLPTELLDWPGKPKKEAAAAGGEVAG